jgi:hypothetical protein
LVTFTNSLVNSATNPDFMYFYAAIDGHRTYRLSGKRGTSRFIHVVQNSGMIGLDEAPGAPLAMLDIDTLHLSPQGRFSVLLSADAPREGDWWRLHPAASSISIRQASCDWIAEEDGYFALECLDAERPPARLDAADIAERLRGVGQFTRRYLRSLNALRDHLNACPVNTLQVNEWRQFGGLECQYYYQGRFELAEDEALLIESDVPETVRYWGIVVLDELFNAIDWTHNQTSLNDRQARLGSDGRFRAILAIKDPGVWNWLDPVGRRRGLIQGRWFEASCGPVPAITRISIDKLWDHIPPDSPVVSPRERVELLNARTRGAQYRRKW